VTTSPDGYLTILGYIERDNQLTLLPGFTTQNADTLYDQAMKRSNIAIVTTQWVGPKGETLLEYKIPAVPFHGDPEPTVFGVRTTIPFLPNASALNFVLDGNVIYTLPVPQGVPSVKITWQPPDGPVTGQQTITWEGSHTAGASLYYLLAYSPDGGKSYQPVSLSLRDPKYVLDFDQLAGGTGQLLLTASDGVNTVRVTSPTFSVPIKPCYPMIMWPHDGATVPAKEPLWLEGQGYYREEASPELQALSWSIDGQDTKLQGNVVIAPGLAPGTHQITLLAGKGDRVDKVGISITAK
jgi:hypothetical protein